MRKLDGGVGGRLERVGGGGSNVIWREGRPQAWRSQIHARVREVGEGGSIRKYNH